MKATHDCLWAYVNVKDETFHYLHMVVVLQILGVKPLLEGKVSQQVDVGLCYFPPMLLLIHHLFQTTKYTQTQLLQCLYIWMTHERHINIPRHIHTNISASVMAHYRL